MREYLLGFLDRFGYDTADVAVLLAAYDRLAQDALGRGAGSVRSGRWVRSVARDRAGG